MRITADNSVQLWEIADNRMRGRFQGHAGPITCLSFSPDGRYLVSGSQDGTALVWGLSAKSMARAAKLTGKDAEKLWRDLASSEGPRAFQAIQTLTSAADDAISIFKARLHRPTEMKQETITARIRDLDSPTFGVRERAYKALKEVGPQAEKQVRKALEGKPSLEVHNRLSAILKSMDSYTTSELRHVRALETLELLDTRAARDLLRGLAADKEGGRLTRAARESLQRLESRAGSPVENQ
jgi:hypothetical protein